MTAANVSRIPANAPRPQDRKPPAKKAAAAAAARRAEAGDGYVDIEQRGVSLRVPVGENIPYDAWAVGEGDEEALTRLKIRPQDAERASIRIMLGDEQWSAFIATRPLLADIKQLGDKVQEVQGN